MKLSRQKKSLITTAIKEQRKLSFTYDGQYRIVEPYTLGISSQDNYNLSAYQTEGSSKSNEVPAWKLFSTHKIQNLRVTDESFDKIRSDYMRGDARMEKILVEVTY